MAEAGRRRRLQRWRGRIIAAIVVAVLAGGGATAWAMTGSSGAAYRTAVASTASVTQQLQSVGTLSSVNKAVVSFPVSGRVAALDVAVGDAVSAGQVLATLDTTSLQQSVAQAQQTLADSQEKLAQDETSQTGSGTSSASSTGGAGSTSSGGQDATNSASEQPLTGAPDSSAGTPSTTSSTAGSGSAPSSGSHGGAGSGAAGTGGSSSGGSVSALVAAVKSAQQQLSTDQQALDLILSATSLADLRNLIATGGPCAVVPAAATTFTATSDSSGDLSVSTPGPATVTAGSATVGAPTESGSSYTYPITGSPNTAYTVSVTPTTGSIDATTCTAAIQTLVSALDASPSDNAWSAAQAVNTDELTLAGAISRLEKAAETSSSSGHQPGSSSTATSSSSKHASSTSGTGGASQSTAGKSSSGASGNSAPATPQQLAADQASIDAANANLAVADQNVAQATIRSPITGTVAAVGLTQGAAAGSNAVTVIGPGAEQVDTTVSLSDVALVKVGQPASVAVDGITAPLTGRVTSIGVLNTTTGSTTSYPVTVLLDPSSAHLFDGSGAAVSITVGQVSNVLTVPSSAVHSLNNLHTVTVLDKGKAVLTRVGVGAVGLDLTQITSGLSAGQRIVLAQLNLPLPSSTSTAGLRGTGLAGVTTGLGGISGTGTAITRKAGG